MRIKKEEVEKLAHLSRLQLDDASIEKMQSDMNKMLGFVDKINELDLDGVEPMSYMNEASNVLRADDVENTASHEEALLNAPDKNSDYFRVPKVVKR
jgi:aspartyl-tRNA(Asn)/glutamyl-tRNA(Gln) amidotransferase subunit C